VFDFILNPLKIVVSWILVQFHSIFSSLFGASSGVTWALSIVGLVLVIRIVLIPLFVKQIKSQRNLQLIQPQMKEIQTKYAGDRERQAMEMQKLYRETGTNPLSSCFPLLAQTPIFFALFSVLQGIAHNAAQASLAQGVFQWDQYFPLLNQAHNATLFGVPLYGTFMNAHETASPQSTRILAMALVVLMTATTFITQRQLIVKNVAADNPMVQQQKVLLYVFPFVFAIGGVGFPIGVLLYWLTTNLWSMGQQFYVIRNNPAPGTPAHKAYLERKAAKDKKHGVVSEESSANETETKTQRVQPKRQARSKRKK
jgi:YidC/Oxa1 family membrane protein insertase